MADDCTNCKQSQRMDYVESDISQIQDELKEHRERFSKLELSDSRNSQAIEFVKQLLQNMDIKIDGLSSMIKETKEAPSKYLWGILSGIVIGGIVAFISYLLMK